MALAAGNVTISSSGGETITAGISATIYAALKTNASNSFAAFGQTLPPAGAQLATILGGLAGLSNAIGGAIFTELTTNAKARAAINAFSAGDPPAQTDLPIV